MNRKVLEIAVLLLLVLVVAGTAYAGLSDGLVRYYPFNGNADDESETGNHSTIHGATLTTDRCGNPDKAYHFDGSSYIEATANGLPTHDRTVSLWFRPEPCSRQDGWPNMVPLAYGGGGPEWPQGKNAFIIHIWVGDAYGTCAHYDQNMCYTSAYMPELLEWHHWIVIINNNDISMYMNGQYVGACTNKFEFPTVVQERELSLGVAVNNYGDAPYIDYYMSYFNGSLDDIRIYNRALSESEIAELYSESCVIDPTVTITAPDSLGSEGGPSSGCFTISRTGNTDGPLKVKYAITGTATYARDYTIGGNSSRILRGCAVIPKNRSFVSLVVNPIKDRLTEGDETVIVTFKASDDYEIGTPDTATVTIKDYK